MPIKPLKQNFRISPTAGETVLARSLQHVAGLGEFSGAAEEMEHHRVTERFGIGF